MFQDMSKPIVIYGLAANPPHVGHWSCVRFLVDQGFNVLITPSYSHAFGKDMAPFLMRVDWLERAGLELGLLDGSASVWCGEADCVKSLTGQAADGSPVYSIDILRWAQKCGYKAKLAIGPDNADPQMFSKFKDYAVIASEYGVVVLPETYKVRSTFVRENIHNHVLIESLVGKQVSADIIKFFSKESTASYLNGLVKFK